MSQGPAVARKQTESTEVLEQLVSVAREARVDPLVLRLMEIRTWLKDDLADLEKSCLKLLDGDAPLGPDNPGGDSPARGAARHLLRLPGKWIRPICLLMASRIGNRAMDSHVRDLALTCELVHGATLLHDDVLDEGDVRRGKETSRIAYSNAASVLGGDHVLILALQMAHRSCPPHVFSALLTTIDTMVNAEAHQLVHKGTFDPSREVYQRVILGKTAVLFRWALMAGGHLAGLTREQETALAEAGSELGMAFQLVDDILDLIGETSATGKSLHTDLEEGKMTWPLILAAEATPEAIPLIKSVAQGQESPEKLVALLRELGTIEATREEARKHSERAIALLDELPPGRAVEALKGIVHSAIERSW